MGTTRLVFLPRHGPGHRLPPGEINARANIDALKRAGCTDVLSLSAVGSLRESLSPGTFVVVDQFIDRTAAGSRVLRRGAGGPCLDGRSGLPAAGGPRRRRRGGRQARAWVEGGTYLAMEGPQFSSRAESELYRSWGCSVIGMTNMPEARLAREAELPYASVAMVTDYDCWRLGEAPVAVDQILAVLQANAAGARAMVRRLALALPPERPASPIDTCLDGAIITAPEARDPAMAAKLEAVAGRALRAGHRD